MRWGNERSVIGMLLHGLPYAVARAYPFCFWCKELFPCYQSNTTVVDMINDLHSGQCSRQRKNKLMDVTAWAHELACVMERIGRRLVRSEAASERTSIYRDC